MSIYRYFDERARRLGIIDFKLAQGAAIFFALSVVKVAPEFLRAGLWLYVTLMVLCAIRPAITFFGAGKRE